MAFGAIHAGFVAIDIYLDSKSKTATTDKPVDNNKWDDDYDYCVEKKKQQAVVT